MEQILRTLKNLNHNLLSQIMYFFSKETKILNYSFISNILKLFNHLLDRPNLEI